MSKWSHYYLGEAYSRQKEQQVQRPGVMSVPDVFKEQQGGIVPRMQQAREGKWRRIRVAVARDSDHEVPYRP